MQEQKKYHPRRQYIKLTSISKYALQGGLKWLTELAFCLIKK